MVNTSAVSLLLTPLKEVTDGDKHAAVAAENYYLSQWPEAEETPTKPSGEAQASHL